MLPRPRGRQKLRSMASRPQSCQNLQWCRQDWPGTVCFGQGVPATLSESPTSLPAPSSLLLAAEPAPGRNSVRVSNSAAGQHLIGCSSGPAATLSESPTVLPGAAGRSACPHRQSRNPVRVSNSAAGNQADDEELDQQAPQLCQSLQQCCRGFPPSSGIWRASLAILSESPTVLPGPLPQGCCPGQFVRHPARGSRPASGLGLLTLTLAVGVSAHLVPPPTVKALARGALGLRQAPRRSRTASSCAVREASSFRNSSSSFSRAEA